VIEEQIMKEFNEMYVQDQDVLNVVIKALKESHQSEQKYHNQAIYKEYYGKEIDKEEATDQAHKLVRFVKLMLECKDKEDREKLKNAGINSI